MKVIIPLFIFFSVLFNPIKVYILGDDVFLHLSNKFTFENNSAKLKLNVKKQLDVIALRLIERPKLRIAVEAHTDIESKPQIAKSITTERAENIKSYLVGRGVNAENIEAIGYGFDRPLIECVDMFNCTPEENKKNRRVVIRIINTREVGDYLLVNQTTE